MPQMLAHIALIVRDYDEAIAFFVGKLGFELKVDMPEQGKRWVVVAPQGNSGSSILLARAASEHQAQFMAIKPGGGSSCS